MGKSGDFAHQPQTGRAWVVLLHLASVHLPATRNMGLGLSVEDSGCEELWVTSVWSPDLPPRGPGAEKPSEAGEWGMGGMGGLEVAERVAGDQILNLRLLHGFR